MLKKHTDSPEHNEIDHMIAWHDGDAHAAIRTLLQDCRDLRAKLALACQAKTYGATDRRGRTNATKTVVTRG